MELSGERGWALKDLISHGKRTGRERGRVGSSPTQRESTKTARDGGFARPTNNSGDGSHSALTEGSRGEGKAKWARRRAQARGVFSNLKPRRGEGTWGERGRGLGPDGFHPREKGGSGLRQLEKEMLTGGPGLSAGERGEGRGRRLAGGPRPRERGARGGVLGRKAE